MFRFITHSYSKNHRYFLSTLMIIAGCLNAGCSSSDHKSTYPQSKKEKELYKHGSMFGGEGGINLLGSSKSKAAAQTGISVNVYLWRATLDVVSFLPLKSADPFGGVVITNWYYPPNFPKTRFKVNVLILGSELKSENIRLTVFKQEQKSSSSAWTEVGSDPMLAQQLEEKILTAAREYRVKSK